MKTYGNNKCRCSDGSTITRSALEAKIRKSKAELIKSQLYDMQFNWCQKCNRSAGVYLDCAHIVSVDKCIKSGQSELAHSVNNMMIMCRDCHKEHDGNKLEWANI